MNKPVIIEQVPDRNLPIPGINFDRLRELRSEFGDYLASGLAGRDYSESSIISYANGIGRFFAWLEENPEPISPVTFVNYRSFLNGEAKAKRLSPSTANLSLVGVRKFITWLYEIGEIPNNPVLGLTGLKQSGRGKLHKRDALTPREVRKLLDSIPLDSAVDLRDRAIIGAMVFGGLRTIEISRASLGNYGTRQERRILEIQGKGRGEADDLIVVSPELEDILSAWIAVIPSGDNPRAPLFPSLSRRSAGEPLSTSAIRRMVKERLRNIGIREARKSTHSLRHAAISAVIRGKGTLLQAQSFARHSSPNTTQIYIHETDRLENPPELLIEY